MKSIYIYVTVLFFNFSLAQKKELRQIKRLIDQKFYQEAESVLESNKDFLLSGDSKTDAQYYYYATKIYTEIKSFKLATNSLDKKSEDEILQNLFNDDCTILFISHDKEKIKLCDKVIDLNDIQK